MTKATMVLATLLAVTAAPLGTAALLLMPATASAEQTVSAAVGKPLKAAQDAIARKKWDQALNSIKQAQGVQPRTAYDDYKINELLWYVYLQQGKNSAAAKLLEQQIASPQMPASEKTPRTKTLAQMYFRANEFGNALRVGNQYYLDEEWSTIHGAFHLSLVSACQSPNLLQIREKLFARAHRYRRMSSQFRSRWREKDVEHKAIMETVVAREEGEALVLIDRHIRETTENVIEHAGHLFAPSSAGWQLSRDGNDRVSDKVTK